MIVSAPGKLMLSGEWSVLEKGAPCIVLAINKKAYASVKESGETIVRLKSLGVETKAVISGTKINFKSEDDKLLFTQHATETVLKYLKGGGIKTKNFELETWSDSMEVEVRGEKKKVGFGSSAAATVAITGALLRLHGIGIETGEEKNVLFKLSIVAHYFAQGKIGSGFDVAASTFGGALIYRRFDAEWLQKELRGKSVHEVANEKWPGLEYRNLKLPKKMVIMVGFTGRSASTKELVQKINEFKKQKPGKYEKIISGIKEVTVQLAEAIGKSDEKKIVCLIDANRELLSRLSEESEANLEISEHRKMSEIAAKHGAVAKFSGAGGGDSGIGITFDKRRAEKIILEWEKNGITLIDAKISGKGATQE